MLQAVRRHLARRGIPCAEPIPDRGGRGWETFQGRAVEVEPYLAAPAVMNTLPRVRTGLTMLGRIHALLQEFPADPAAAAPRFANYVAAQGLVEAEVVGPDGTFSMPRMRAGPESVVGPATAVIHGEDQAKFVSSIRRDT